MYEFAKGNISVRQSICLLSRYLLNNKTTATHTEILNIDIAIFAPFKPIPKIFSIKPIATGKAPETGKELI